MPWLKWGTPNPLSKRSLRCVDRHRMQHQGPLLGDWSGCIWRVQWQVLFVRKMSVGENEKKRLSLTSKWQEQTLIGLRRWCLQILCLGILGSRRTHHVQPRRVFVVLRERQGIALLDPRKWFLFFVLIAGWVRVCLFLWPPSFRAWGEMGCFLEFYGWQISWSLGPFFWPWLEMGVGSFTLS